MKQKNLSLKSENFDIKAYMQKELSELIPDDGFGMDEQAFNGLLDTLMEKSKFVENQN